MDHSEQYYQDLLSEKEGLIDEQREIIEKQIIEITRLQNMEKTVKKYLKRWAQEEAGFHTRVNTQTISEHFIAFEQWWVDLKDDLNLDTLAGDEFFTIKDGMN